jgi:hypothetical protein
MSDKTAKIFKLLAKAKQSHRAALSALDRSSRSTGGTATWKKAVASYEKHDDAFEKAMNDIELLLTGGTP